MIFSEGGSHFGGEPPDSPDSMEEEGGDNEAKIIIKETYNGSEDPWIFLQRVTEKAAAKDLSLTIEDIIRQSKEQEGKEKDNFSFDSIETELAKNIIFPGLTISLRKRAEKKDAKEIIIEEHDDIDDNDDDDDDDDEKKAEKKEESITEERRTILEDASKIKEVLHSKEGRGMEERLENIKRRGKLLLTELTNCTGTESEKAIKLRLLLFEEMETAEKIGKDLTQTIKDQFQINLRRELAPMLIIRSYLRRKYREQKIPIPKGLLGIEIIEDKESLTAAVDDRPR